METTTSDNWGSGNLGDTITLADGTTTTYNPVGALKGAGLLDPRPVAPNGGLNTISSANPSKRFDYILYAPQNISYLSGQVINTAFGTNGLATNVSSSASDHLAVFETFILAPEASSIAFLASVLVGAGFQRRYKGRLTSQN